MPGLIGVTPLIVLLKIYFAWGIESSTCGHLPPYNIPQLTNSNPTRPWPWHAAIFHRHYNSNPTYECGGTVINQNWILTASHCVDRNGAPMEPNEISVSLGRLNLSADEAFSEQAFNVTKIIRHENYVATTLQNDIALIQLSHTAILNYFVRPICLWQSSTDLSSVVGRYGTVVGWGKTEKFELSPILQEAHLEIVSYAQCLVSNRDLYGSFLTEMNFCAGLQNGTSVCKGDSGGSMTIEKDGVYYIRGIVSSSPSKMNRATQQLECDTMQYAIFTDVAKFLQWISVVTQINCQEVLQCPNWHNGVCGVHVHTKPYEWKCEIIFDETPDLAVTSLAISGESEYIPDLSDAVIKFENLEELRLPRINLKVIEKARLVAFRKIKVLDLSNNHITQLDADTFSDLKEIQRVFLGDNSIEELSVDIFKGLNNLTSVTLNVNKLETLPRGLFRDNHKLQRIDFEENQLKELHVDIFKGLNNLRSITLRSNKLEILPQGLFRDNHELQQINLYQNQLKELHVDVFKGLHNLRELYLYENQLQTLPEGIFRENHNLTVIQLYNNKLTPDLPHHLFSGNKNLEEISLSKNLISELHTDIFAELHNLKRIILDENRFEVLPAGLFCKNQKIESMHFGENQLKELHVDIFKGPYNLTEINLKSNRLEILPQGLFRENHNLKRIYLGDNRLKELHVDVFKGLYYLEELYLNDNQLETLPQGLFQDISNLRVIFLDTNRIMKIQSDFSHLSSLTILSMLENVCVDELFEISLSTNEINEINDEIRTKCSE